MIDIEWKPSERPLIRSGARAPEELFDEGDQLADQFLRIVLGEDQRWQQADDGVGRDVEHQAGVERLADQLAARTIEHDADHQSLAAQLDEALDLAELAGEGVAQQPAQTVRVLHQLVVLHHLDRAIRRGAGLEKDAAEIEEVTYEGYGPHGIAIIVECLTDNRNRTISEVRRCFTRANGSLGEPNSVAWQFTENGYLAFNLFDADEEPKKIDADELFMVALEAGAVDVQTSDDVVEVYTERNELAQVAQALSEAGFTADESQLVLKPNTTISLEVEQASAVLNLIEALEELDDVSNVYHNLEMTDELVEQFA